MIDHDGAASGRLRSLDGLRGVAIIGVILCHCYGPEFAWYLPFGDHYSEFYPARNGWAGRLLFFLIPGFVILMTLEKCRSLSEFAVRRWLRLFPAMFVGSLVILTFDWTTRAGPQRQPGRNQPPTRLDIHQSGAHSRRDESQYRLHGRPIRLSLR